MKYSCIADLSNLFHINYFIYYVIHLLTIFWVIKTFTATMLLVRFHSIQSKKNQVWIPIYRRVGSGSF